MVRDIQKDIEKLENEALSKFELTKKNFETNYIQIKIKNKVVDVDEHLYNFILSQEVLSRHKFDCVTIIDGYRGNGKSTIAEECGLILQENMNHNNIIYSIDQFNEFILKEENKPIIMDEFLLMAMKGDSREVINEIIKNFNVIREKRFKIFLIVQDFFSLPFYFACRMSRVLIKIESYGIGRGFFKAYDREQLTELYLKGKWRHSYSPDIKPIFKGTFKDWTEDFLDKDKIREKKFKALEYQNKKKKEIKLTKKQMDYILEIPLSSVFPHDSPERYTLSDLQQEIKQLRSLNLGVGENQSCTYKGKEE